MKACVIDASVAVKWYVPEVYSKEAWNLLAAREEGEVKFHVPDLFTSELGNILWKKVRRGLLEEEEAREIARELLAIPMSVHGSTDMFEAVLRLACRAGITFCDALYVVLATGLGCPLITADERLMRAAAKGDWGGVVHPVWKVFPDQSPSLVG